MTTEAEAAKTWCPQCERFSGRGGRIAITVENNCIGSLCAVWDWLDDGYEYKQGKQGAKIVPVEGASAAGRHKVDCNHWLPPDEEGPWEDVPHITHQNQGWFRRPLKTEERQGGCGLKQKEPMTEKCRYPG